MCAIGQQCPRDELRKKRALSQGFIDGHTLDLNWLNDVLNVVDRGRLQMVVANHIEANRETYYSRSGGDVTIIIGTPSYILDVINAFGCPVSLGNHHCDFTVVFPNVIELQVDFSLEPIVRVIRLGPRRVTLRAFYSDTELEADVYNLLQDDQQPGPSSRGAQNEQLVPGRPVLDNQQPGPSSRDPNRVFPTPTATLQQQVILT